MVATALDLSQIKTDALSSAATFRSLIELGSTDTPTFAGTTLAGDIQQKKTGSFAMFGAKDNGSQIKVRIDSNTESVSLSSTTSLGWSSTNSANNAFDDVILERDAANTLAQRNGTNANEYRVYNTFTDASNYERGFLKWDANTFKIGTEAAGTGTARTLTIENVAKINGSTSSAADPSTTEYPNDGDHGIHKNTTSGNVFLAYNDGGGSIVKVQLS